MLAALSLLLVCQLIGEVLVRWLALPLPGPVAGMLLLFLLLVLRDGPDENLRHTSQGLLQHLSLLFVPAGTGIVLHFSRIGEHWPALVASLLLSTLAALLVTAGTMRLCQRLSDGEEK